MDSEEIYVSNSMIFFNIHNNIIHASNISDDICNF